MYIAKQGDTWDLISYVVYGKDIYTDKLIDANWQYAGLLFFDGGEALFIPDINTEENDYSPWS